MNILKIIKANKWDIFKVAVMALAAIVVPYVSYAQNATTSTVTTITEPLTTIQNFMTDFVPNAMITVGSIVGIASWVMNIENQITKMAMRVVGVGAIVLGAAEFISQTVGFLIP